MRFSPENADFTKKQSQFKPNLTQYKANSNPNLSKFIPESCRPGSQQGTNFTTLKGANSKPLFQERNL
jgi:hypothetical protein